LLNLNPIVYIINILTENYKTQITFNKSCNYNQIYVYLLNKHVNIITNLMKFDLNFSEVSCLELSAFQKNNNIYVYWVYIHYKMLKNFIFITNTNVIKSYQMYFKNLLFLEREVQEMFGLKILNLIDNRNLLLDYNKQYNPLLKSFFSEGFEEVYLNLFTDKLNYLQNYYIEL